ncbi:hypothetical protein D9758_007439 [Tetrapyrgos nigripes]|uniref:Uncharacterized protein n=1 Tax=Tetrapyrgos nigripes TaxID=182062 RepID=A0A8H5LHW3_9AGAR|nr:hypothetical protein D9758_007439 [Tetrapyrgos nigripes]
MSVTVDVDNLVASLSSSHIGQEAIDLAALQAQLTQAFFAQSFPPSSSHSNQSRGVFTQPCSTPTGRTPSTSFSWGQMMDTQRMSCRNADEYEHSRDVDDMEDERMVEDLLIPSSPINPSSTSSFAQVTPKSQPKSPMGFSPSSPSFFPASESSSTFTSTDPFYLAQLQSVQHNAPPPSVFAQLGRPAQQSPFTQPISRREGFSFASPSVSGIPVESCNLFMSTSSSTF